MLKLFSVLKLKENYLISAFHHYTFQTYFTKRINKFSQIKVQTMIITLYSFLDVLNCYSSNNYLIINCFT